MHKVGDDTPTANGADEFQESPTATDLRSDTLNTWQRELVKIVEGAGLVLDGTNDEQIWSVFENATQFFPHGESTPSMKVVIEAGRISAGRNYIDQVGQVTALIVAPTTDPRIDRIAIDNTTGLYTVITGTEDPAPDAPDYSSNHSPICQFRLETTTTTISLDAQSATNSQIVNERCSILSVEDWHEVGSAGEPAFLNGWVNFGGTSNPATAAFYKDQWGVVHVKGYIKNGSVTNDAFYLPVGYRPPRQVHFSTVSNGAFGSFRVKGINGGVSIDTGSNVSFSIQCSFKT